MSHRASLILVGMCSLALIGASAAARAGGIFLVDKPDAADVTVFIVAADDISEADCYVSTDEIDATMQPGDLKVYVTKDPNDDATYIAMTDVASEADPVDCLNSD